ncbi:MAG TPA: hypothetical protein VM144_04380 [Aestuariivirga sp.]|nr:hypothetical protein [Aestuariivirga sp.]
MNSIVLDMEKKPLNSPTWQKEKIAEFRARALASKEGAQADPLKASSWLEVAEEWTRMADDLERKLGKTNLDLEAESTE